MDLKQNIEREEIIDIIVAYVNYEYAQISSLLSNSSISSWDLSLQSDMNVDMNSEEGKKKNYLIMIRLTQLRSSTETISLKCSKIGLNIYMQIRLHLLISCLGEEQKSLKYIDKPQTPDIKIDTESKNKN